ncbi:hypothetical protein [Nocardiopsis sp. NPDC057823]|uniref:hypothetical protein n=1 Tax=Nocardiopsis sp. NPDC057823 TaxID=3346256 RepID=UPI00366C6209
MKNLYARIIAELTLPKGDGGYSTETVIITAVLVGIAITAGGVIYGVATEQIALIGGE